MDSLTKRRLGPAELADVVVRAFGPSVSLADAAELTSGMFNTAYALTLDDGRKVVLKVAPPPGLRLLRYEVDLMHAEALFYRLAGRAGVALPDLLHADPDRGLLVISRLHGEPLNTALDRLGDEEPVRRELSAIAARLHTVTGDLFGYPRRDGHTRSRSWRESFLTMVDDILADAADWGVELPAPAASIGAVLRRHGSALEEVRTPVLVHFDLWDGNVFVAPGAVPGSRAAGLVEGIIDGERAFYGDPLAEFVSMALFRDPESVPGLLSGYPTPDGAPLEIRDGARARLRLYTVYLYLVMIVEGPSRGYAGDEHQQLVAHTTGLLLEQLAAL